MKVPDIVNWKRKYYRQVCAGGIWCTVSAGISIKVDVRLKNVTACSYTKSWIVWNCINLNTSHLNDSWKCKINDKLDYRLDICCVLTFWTLL
jgi:hypothetical protein